MVGDKVSDMEAGQAAGVGRLFRVVSAAKGQTASSSSDGKQGVVLVKGLPDVARIVSGSQAPA